VAPLGKRQQLDITARHYASAVYAVVCPFVCLSVTHQY